MQRRALMAVVVGTFLTHSISAQAVTIEWAIVGDPGNEGEWSQGAGFAQDRICGAVDYIYQISKYEVTNGQYVEFLNGVASTSDPYGLYNPSMSGQYGGISRSGNIGSYSYGPKGGDNNWLDRPVNYVSFWDACRFVNWISNGCGEGDTETGVYPLNGIINPTNLSITRKPNAKIFIPTEDEWYKAAYYDPTLNGGSGGYYDYATGTDTPPNNNPPSDDTVNSANIWYYGLSVGGPYYTTEVGAYALSESPWSTFDQCGNLREWNESIIKPWYRGWRGDYYGSPPESANWRGNYAVPTFEERSLGFRVAAIPEPATLLLLGLGAVILRKRR